MANIRTYALLLTVGLLLASSSLARGEEEQDADKGNAVPILPAPGGTDLKYVGTMTPPESYRCVANDTCRFADFLSRICILVVVQHDKVVYHYFNDDPSSGKKSRLCTKAAGFDTQFGVASIAKSITSTLLGMARADGSYGSIELSARLDTFETRFDKIPGQLKLENALLMRGGLKEDDSGQKTHKKFKKKTIDNPVMTLLDGINRYAEEAFVPLPGVKFRYSNMTSAAIGTALEAILKSGPIGGPQTLAQALKKWIWDPVGMAGAARWKADKANSPSPYCCLYMRAYDLAKFGNYVLEQRTQPQEPLYSWLQLATSREGRLETDACFSEGDEFRLGYRYQWWTFQDDTFGFAAKGTGGQFLHIMPKDDLVIVQFSSIGGDEYDAFQCDSWSVHAAIRKRLTP